MSDGPASIVVRRPLDWMDTDAAGIWHWTSGFRHLEAAEHALHAALGVTELTFGWTPRARLEVDFRSPVRFGETVTSTLRVDRVGRSSIVYAFALSVDDRAVAEGRLVTVLVDDDGSPIEVPDALRRPLLTAGDVGTAG